MNAFDIALVLMLAVFVGIGVWRGFVRELISLVTWIGACVAAWMLSDRLASLFEKMTTEEPVRKMLAFVIVFVTVFLVGTIIGTFLHKVVNRNAGLRNANRVAGGVIGLARGATIVVVMFLLAGLTSFPQRQWWRDAVLAPPFEHAATFATRFLPPDIARHLRYG